VSYESLDNYFDELIGTKDKQNKAIKEELVSVAVDKTTAVNTKVDKPIVDKTERVVWGDYE
jgi:predicted transcriptional regulator YdeE